jgi:putative SOS response-associated peptidase YedK
VCGRFSFSADDLEEAAAPVHATVEREAKAGHRPRYNIAPTSEHVIVLEDGARWLVRGRWGLGEKGHINARAETALELPAFATAVRSGRCLVPADGFFEWAGGQPIWFHHPDQKIFWMAGLQVGRAFAILTTDANRTVGEIHHRMPAVLDAARARAWLEAREPARALAMLAPAGADWLVARPVSRRVSSVANDDPGCIAQAPRAPTQLRLL